MATTATLKRFDRTILPDGRLHSILRRWHAKRTGCELDVPYMPHFDTAWLLWCADAHDAASHAPTDKATVRAYDCLKQETLEQFLLVSEAGYRLEFWPGIGEPYSHSRFMIADVRNQQHLWVYRTGDDFPFDHPLAEQSPLHGWTFNDLFRAVHDVIGHAWNGYSFSMRDEEAACRSHMIHYSSAAHSALVCETRMQNAWIYCGRHRRNAAGKIITPWTTLLPFQFPEQKAFVPAREAVDYDGWKVAQGEASKCLTLCSWPCGK